MMINAWSTQFLGRDAADTIDQPMSRFCEDQTHDDVLQADDTITRTFQPETHELTYHLPGGDRIGLMTFFPVSDGKGEGEVTQIGAMLIDVNDLHITPTELLATRELLSSVFDNFPAALYLRELSGTFVKGKS